MTVPFNFTVDVPDGLAKVFDPIALFAGTPEVLDGVPDTEVHVLGNNDALYPTRVGCVMQRVVH
jgi:hypothetical protein